MDLIVFGVDSSFKCKVVYLKKTNKIILKVISLPLLVLKYFINTEILVSFYFARQHVIKVIKIRQRTRYDKGHFWPPLQITSYSIHH